MTAPFTVALDCDGVLFDFVRAFQETFDEGLPYDLQLGKHWRPDQWDISKSFPLNGQNLAHHVKLVRTYENCALGRRVRPYPHAVNFLRHLHATGARIVFATSPLQYNKEWCHHRILACNNLCTAADIPELPIVFTSDKTLVRANLLIDDRAESVRAFDALSSDTAGVLFDQPYNRTESVPNRYRYASGLQAWSHLPRSRLRGVADPLGCNA